MMNIQEVILLFLTLCLTQLAVRTDDSDTASISKRAPGWGKRDATNKLGYLENVLSGFSRYDTNSDNVDLGLNKRRPGWGKRSFPSEFELDKRKPGWGKRSYSYDANPFEYSQTGSQPSYEDIFDTERAKRRPGWGKRSMYEDLDMEKRRPGWGKRSPGWGKRSGEPFVCRTLINEMRSLRLKVAQIREDISDTCPSLSLEEKVIFGS